MTRLVSDVLGVGRGLFGKNLICPRFQNIPTVTMSCMRHERGKNAQTQCVPEGKKKIDSV